MQVTQVDSEDKNLYKSDGQNTAAKIMAQRSVSTENMADTLNTKYAKCVKGLTMKFSCSIGEVQ